MLVWLNPCKTPKFVTPEEPVVMEKQNKEIPDLSDYTRPPNSDFWKIFPSHNPKVDSKPPVKRSHFRKFVQKHWFSWTAHQRAVAKRALRNLSAGCLVKLVKALGKQKCKNANSAFKNGKLITDAIVSWIKKGFVAGPYKSAPLTNFRQNPLMAAVQRTKVRPILNLSSPNGSSFNDAVDPIPLHKLRMSSAKLFGEALLKMGRGAIMSKYDIKDAYKLIRNHKEQWNCYGFKWLGKYFFDTTMVFGSKAAPEKFDSLPETLVNIACSESGLPKHWVFRQLDDVPVVAPAGSDLVKKFSDCYEKVCAECGVPLADFCPQREKAFREQTKGTVLGVEFDTQNLTWKLSANKTKGILERIAHFSRKKTCKLRDVQKLHGKISDFAQMGVFMKGFRFNVLALLKKFGNSERVRKLIPETVKEDLRIWAECVKASLESLPIPESRSFPTLNCVEFISDAAGAAYQWDHGTPLNITVPGDRGVASVGFAGDEINFLAVVRWPNNLIFEAKDWRGTAMGHKSATLEAVGLLLPFLCIPQKLQHRHVILYVDNITVVGAWEKRYCRNDPETSSLIRALHVIEAFLECIIHVRHRKRMSTPEAILADHWSRESTITGKSRKSISHLRIFTPKGALSRWLQEPRPHWNLGQTLVKEITQKLYS